MPAPKDPIKLAAWKLRQSQSHMGQNLGGSMPPRTDSWKQKQRDARVGIPLSDETRQRMSDVRIGVPKSMETRRRMSESHKKL